MQCTEQTFKRAARATRARAGGHWLQAGPIMGLVGFIAVAAALAATLYFSWAHGSDRVQDGPHAAEVSERTSDPATPGRQDAQTPAATFHEFANFDGIEPESDPSPRAVAAYER